MRAHAQPRAPVCASCLTHPPRLRYIRVPTGTRLEATAAALQSRLLGGRQLRLEPTAAVDFPEPPPALEGYTERAVLVSNLADAISLHDVEAFFAGYSLAPDAVKTLRRQRDGGAAGSRRAVVVRFNHALEAQRAVREKHREFVGAAAVEVALLQ